MADFQCAVCGGAELKFSPVLWPELVDEWRLAPAEAEYINRQQGECCTSCGANLRSALLARMICRTLGVPEPLRSVSFPRDLKILEINEAGTLSPVLARAPGHVLSTFPQVDMQMLPFPAETFDLVVHSDTLEHVEHPLRGLAECRRVLKVGGACCFTVPVVVGRLTVNRTGLPESYHGSRNQPEYLVRTEFGADVWTYLAVAGFDHIEASTLNYPAASAWTGRRLIR